MSDPEKSPAPSNEPSEPEQYLERFDVWAIIKRREIILTLILQGKIDPEAGMEIYEATAATHYRQEEREAFLALEEYYKTGENMPHYENSPMARLFEQLIRLKPQFPPFSESEEE